MSSRRHAPVREPELSELRAFCAAVVLGSIAEAARAMHVSQPAMSKRLRALETVTGNQLLIRSTRGVTLTPAGEQLYIVAQRVLAIADSVNALMKSPVTSDPARIAASPTVADERIPLILAQVAAAGEPLAVELTIANSWVVRELVKEGMYELGVAAVDRYIPRADDLKERMLWKDEVVVGVPAGHPWLQYHEIPVEVFTAQPLVERDPWAHSSRLVTVILERAELQRAAPAIQIGSTRSLVAAALTLRTPALLSIDSVEAHRSSGLEVRRVAGITFDREFVLVWSGSTAALSPGALAVAQRLMAPR